MKRIRPNTIPAKRSFTIGDKVKVLENNKSLYSLNNLKRSRFIAVDVCDFCGCYIGIYRNILYLRKIGWKFSCQKCYNKNFYNKSPKEHKILIDQTNFKKNKKK